MSGRGPRVEPGCVDLWCVPPGAMPVPLDRLAGLLDAGEQERAGRFYDPAHRDRFIRAHGLARLILASYLARPPQALRFGAADYGKPFLAGEESFGFNLSHSLDTVALAVAAGLRVGVDVERHRALSDRDGLVRRFFSAAEQRAFAAVPEPGRDTAFFRLWTRKEAYIKALGEGLSCPLDSFSVSLEAEARILAPALPGWSLHDFEPAAGHAGALAVDHPAPQVRRRSLAEISTPR